MVAWTPHLFPRPRDFAGKGRDGPNAPPQNRCAVEQGAGAGRDWGCFGACEHQKGVGHREGACLKLEPASCLPALCLYSPFHPSPRSPGVSQRSRRALGTLCWGLSRGAFQAFLASPGVRQRGRGEEQPTAGPHRAKGISLERENKGGKGGLQAAGDRTEWGTGGRRWEGWGQGCKIGQAQLSL